MRILSIPSLNVVIKNIMITQQTDRATHDDDMIWCVTINKSRDFQERNTRSQSTARFRIQRPAAVADSADNHSRRPIWTSYCLLLWCIMMFEKDYKSCIKVHSLMFAVYSAY
ncbi:unnamed protein product [Amoebophrya sp. A25]|nr:unnamed protein product [Amoebophrya sp. A25]|eukprot:GSA25T00011463001.1